MNVSKGAIVVALVLVIAVVIAALITRGDSVSDPASAGSCEELVSRSAKVVRDIVEDLGTKTREDLEEDDPDNPFRRLDEPFESFQRRAEELQCDQSELRRLACESYEGLDAQGPVAREFLAEFVQNCR
ncbi:MAG TPA: hypothetical protein VM282_02640 [Acidimicrobiales bacterium]|nr:hypothetical protein [Acidimicrobiales bacterium]